MEYKDERSGDLRLRLFRGAVDLAAFPVLRRGSAQLGGIAVDAAIIGASHAVRVRCGDDALTEVLACRTAAAERLEDRLAGVWRLSESARADGYRFESETAPLAVSARRLARLRSEIAAADPAKAVGLAFRFPAGDAGGPPETLLLAEVGGGGARIRSAHVYPNEGVVVWSDSRLEASLAPEAAEALEESGVR